MIRVSYNDARDYLAHKGWIDAKDGGLYDLATYIGWNPGEGTARLDGDFTAVDLINVAVYMMGDN